MIEETPPLETIVKKIDFQGIYSDQSLSPKLSKQRDDSKATLNNTGGNGG